MKRWLIRLFSNKYLKGAVICVITMIFISVIGFAFLLLAGPGMPAAALSIFADVLAILITIPAIIATALIIVMWIHIVIYGSEVKHDKSYWERAVSGQEDLEHGNRK